jgi:hypothetical protein
MQTIFLQITKHATVGCKIFLHPKATAQDSNYRTPSGVR